MSTPFAKLDGDVGVDFLCRVDQDSSSTGVSRVSGLLMGACVRTTAAKDRRISLGRADASVLLGAAFPLCLALIHLTHGAQSLLLPLRGRHLFHETLGLPRFIAQDVVANAGALQLGSRFSERHRAAVRPGVVEQVQVAEGLLGHPARQPRQANGRNDAQLLWTTFSSYPNANATGYMCRLQGTDLQRRRLGELVLREDCWPALRDYPSHTSSAASRPQMRRTWSPSLSPMNTLSVYDTSNGGHSGYVHDAGFALTISKRKQRNRVWIHELRAFPDLEVKLDLSATPDLFAYLESCVPGIVIRTPSGAERPVENFAGLNATLHRIVLVQARVDPRAPTFLARKRAEGKTGREARRALKRQLANVVYRRLHAWAETSLPARITRHRRIEWLVGRRYLSAESLSLVLRDEDERSSEREEAHALQPA